MSKSFQHAREDSAFEEITITPIFPDIFPISEDMQLDFKQAIKDKSTVGIGTSENLFREDFKFQAYMTPSVIKFYKPSKSDLKKVFNELFVQALEARNKAEELKLPLLLLVGGSPTSQKSLFIETSMLLIADKFKFKKLGLAITSNAVSIIAPYIHPNADRDDFEKNPTQHYLTAITKNIVTKPILPSIGGFVSSLFKTASTISAEIQKYPEDFIAITGLEHLEEVLNSPLLVTHHILALNSLDDEKAQYIPDSDDAKLIRQINFGCNLSDNKVYLISDFPGNPELYLSSATINIAGEIAQEIFSDYDTSMESID